MIGMSNDAKERYMRGEYQYARLTMERSPYEPYKGEDYYFHFQTNIVWKQLLRNPHLVNGNYWSVNTAYGTASVANNKLTYTITTKNANQAFTQPSISFTKNHIYLLSCWLTVPQDQVVGVYTGNSVTNIANIKANVRTRIFNIFKSKVTSTRTCYIYPAINSGLNVGAVATLEDACLFDLTEMFGAGKEMLGRFSFLYNFPNNYYEYDVSGDLVPFTIPVYGGSINVSTGVLTIDRYNVDLGYLYWKYSAAQASSGKYRKACTEAIFEPVSPTSIVPDLISSGYVAQSNDLSYRCAEGVAISSNAAGTIYIFDERYAAQNDMPDFANAVRGVTVCYKMFSPVTFQLSPAEVTTLLNENNIWADSGDISVTYRTTAGTQKTESGSLVHITDGANNIPVTSLTADIKCTQNLNGYDHPWVGGGGKNKLNYDAWKTVGIQRGTAVWENNGVTLTATENDCYTQYSASSFTEPMRIPVQEGDVVTLSWEADTNTTGLCYIFGNGQTVNYHVESNRYRKTCVLTIASGITFVTFRMGVSSAGDTISYKNIMVQVNSSDTQFVYEPYSNICPIEGWEEVNVTRAGGNTYNAANLVLSAGSGIEVVDANTIQVVATNGQENRNVYPLIKGTAKTLKFDSAAIRSVGAGETYHIYERVNGVLNSIATVEQTGVTKAVTASVSANADALVIGGWSGLNTMCEFSKIRLATGEIPEPLVITNADIVDGGYSINRYVVTGDSLQFGSCVSGELTLILDNHDGKFDNESFMSKEIHAEVEIMRENNLIERTSLGWFTVDESPKKLSNITLAALDRMMRFEKKVDPTLLSFPITLYELLQRICEICGVELQTGSYNFLNADYNVMEFPSIAQTYRDILSYICEINGSCAYMNINGELVLGWFSSTPAVTLDTSNRFDSDIYEHAVIIYGVSVITETESFHAGTVGFDIQVGHNPLITYDEQAIADSLFAKVGGFTYYPFTASTMPMPFFEPMDGATFVDKEGNSNFVAITDVTFRLNRNTALSGKGQTIRETDYERKYGVSATYANVDEALEIIKNTIIKNAEIVTQQMQEIVSSYTGLYEAISSEFGSYRQETDAKITQNAEGLTQAYTNIQQIDSKYGIALTDTNNAIVQLADGAVATNTNFRSVTEAYIKSGLLFYEGLDPVYGVAVGQLTYEVINGEKLIKRKGVYSVFTAEELAFYVDDVKVAYFRNNKLYISNAEFPSAVRIGDYTLSANGNGFTIR